MLWLWYYIYPTEIFLVFEQGWTDTYMKMYFARLVHFMKDLLFKITQMKTLQMSYLEP